MSRSILAVFLAMMLFLGGAWLTYRLLTKESEEKRVIEASVLLERVREVCQLVTVEGQFNEIYHETNIREVTLYLPIPTYWDFTKKALLEVEGRVLVGYNMEQVGIKLDSTAQQITLSNLPQPSILAIDHEIKYRNLEESYFNSFSPDDYTQLNKNAKDVLRKKAYESGLLMEAQMQGNAMLSALEFMVDGIGWTLIVEPAPALPAPNLAH